MKEKRICLSIAKKGYGTKITILIPIQEELRNKIKITGVETEKEGKEK